MTTALREVEIFGPAREAGSKDFKPFWTLAAEAPAFRASNVKDRKGTKEDETHPLRTLLLDQTQNEKGLRTPRLLSIHAETGDLGMYHKDYSRGLDIRLSHHPDDAFHVTALRSAGQANFRSCGDLPSPKPFFQHIVAAPMLGKDDLWPDFDQGGNIPVPRFRLLNGAIDLRVGTREFRDCLGPLWAADGVKLDHDDESMRLRLTPEGLELEATVSLLDIPDLKGCFLLAPDGKGLGLTLLADRLGDNAPAWRDAWQRLTPDRADAERALGFRLEARSREAVPRLHWQLEVSKGKILPLPQSVRVPGDDLFTRLAGPQDEAFEGVAELRPASYLLSNSLSDLPVALRSAFPAPLPPGRLLLVAEVEAKGGGQNAAKAPGLRLDGLPGTLTARLDAAGGGAPAYALAHDAVALARDLRRAYGLEALSPGVPDPDRPLLWGFAPLDDGWLQLPVANLPPPDAGKDHDLLKAPAPAPASALSGYLRFAQHCGSSRFRSAFGPPPGETGEAPWMVTVEGAQRASLAMLLQRGAAAAGDAPPGPAVIERGAARLDAPEMSTRGLLWLSSDRPDATEALPRLGAGPAAFLDVPLEMGRGEAARGLGLVLTDLSLEATRSDGALTLKRSALGFDASFDGSIFTEMMERRPEDRGRVAKALKVEAEALGGVQPADLVWSPPGVVWRRHARMPMASTMPMTRSATSASRPLESRDLIPFRFDAVAKGLLVSLSWAASSVFPQIGRRAGAKWSALDLVPVKAWPGFTTVGTRTVAGIAMMPFGVPGAELSWRDGQPASKDPWTSFGFALRFDLPPADEGFATATLPLTLAPAEEAPAPLATAHRWVELAALWNDQRRRHQRTRVVGSYLADYAKTGVAGAQPTRDLVGNLTWRTSTDFSLPQPGDNMPYGHALLDGRRLAGSAALRGLDQSFDISGADLVAGTLVKVTGYAPASFEEAGYLMDARRTGVGVTASTDRFLWRPLRAAYAGSSTVTGLATLRQAAAVRVGTEDRLNLWLKDLPVEADGAAIVSAETIDTQIWGDGRLPVAGYEWRLAPAQKWETQLREGLDRIPFHGFALEPLRLTACKLNMVQGKPTGVAEATIVARIHLGPHGELGEGSGNLVEIGLVSDGGDGLKIKQIGPKSKTKPLRFVLDAAPDSGTGVRRRVIVETGLIWDAAAQAPNFNKAVMMVECWERMSRLPNADVATPARFDDTNTPVAVSWFAPKAMPTGLDKGWVRITKATLSTLTGAAGRPTLRLERLLAITPQPEAGLEPANETGFSVAMRNETVIRLTWLGLEIAGGKLAAGTAIRERTGALALTLPATWLELEDSPAARILQPVGSTVALAFGLLAKVGEPVPSFDGAFELSAGRLDGLARLPAAPDGMPARRLDIRRIQFSAQRRRRGSKATVDLWRGGLELTGWLRAHNAIGWPKLEWDPAEPPWPKHEGTNGRVLVKLGTPAVSRAHEVTYILSGHVLSFPLAARIFAGGADAIWLAPAIADHHLTGPGTDVRFRSVETFALGAAQALILESSDHLKKDPQTFAPRYRKAVIKGEVSKTEYEPGMDMTGIGRLGVVLRGASGIEFRTVFRSSQRKGLYLCGGFVGLVAPGEAGPGLLMRLPVLAAMSATPQEDPFATPGMLSQLAWPTQRAGGQELAWVDGQAAQPVRAYLGGARAPTSSSETSLRTALRAGTWSPNEPKAAAEAMALLVEQSFPAIASPTIGSPFFLASAIGVERALASELMLNSPLIVSFIAGSATRSVDGAALTDRTLAATILTRGLPAAETDDVLDAMEGAAFVATLGDDLVVHPWTGPEISGPVPRNMVAAPAHADHGLPRLAMVRSSGGGQWRYDAIDLPGGSWEVAETEDAPDSFADMHRGYPVAPRHDGLWLAPVEEGATAPFVDLDPPAAVEPAESLRSGLAGLSRVVALPGRTERWEPLRPPAWTWYAQLRTPVYEALPFTNLSAPSIQHLAPAAARPRLPTDAAVSAATATLFEKEGAPSLQALVPTQATIASVADRAGILVARVSRLEAAVTDVGAFDPAHGRFGRPAEAGSWTARTERTPRPGPLPPNCGNRATKPAHPDCGSHLPDRRPCASPILPRTPLAAVRGPADTVRGALPGTNHAWTVTLAAAASWRGIVSPNWDGTLRLDAEIDLASAPAPDLLPDTMLAQLILGPHAEGTTWRFAARAMLTIGDVSIPYRCVHVLASDQVFVEVPGTADISGYWRGRASLVLDLRDGLPGLAQGPAVRALADALDDGEAARRIELRLTVRPLTDTSKFELPEPVRTPYALETQDEQLPVGKDRAPLTLRFPLSVCRPNRGALPLAPSTLLFIDPAYDAELGSKPAEHGERIPDDPAIPKGRGDLRLVLSADRARVSRHGAVTFMIDLRFERAAAGRLAALQGKDTADKTATLDGDLLVPKVPSGGSFLLEVRIEPKDGPVRTLRLERGARPAAPLAIRLAHVYELDLGRLREADGAGAQLRAGDMLVLEVAEPAAETVQPEIWDLENSTADKVAKVKLGHLHKDRPVARTLRLLLTDEPVVEPPSALYAALIRRARDKPEPPTQPTRLSLPLYAQSPLPWRVDLRSPKTDFRAGYMRRAATFVWTLSTTVEEVDTGRIGVHIVKMDRSGQTFLPPPDWAAAADYFVRPRPIAPT